LWNFFNTEMAQVPTTLVRHNPDPAERDANADFARAVLANFGQVLGYSIATDTSVHRARVDKLRELSRLPPTDPGAMK
jgi:hypothetical protein